MLTKNNLMLDFETSGVDVRLALPLSLGAVVFNARGILAKKEFFFPYVSDTVFEEGTKLFWEKHSEELKRIRDNATSLKVTQELFYEFIYPYQEDLSLWAKGIDFDLPIFRRFFNTSAPYYNSVDVRTLMKEFPNIKLKRTSKKHNALEDAIYQTEWVLKWVTSQRY